MRTKKLFVAACLFVTILLSVFFVGSVTAQTQGSQIRWDIVSVTANEAGQGVIDAGASAFARGFDASTIMFKGSGTFGPGTSDPVTGGGEWMTWDYDDNPTGNGTFIVTGFVSWVEAPGGLPAEFIVDKIGANEDSRAGVAVLTIAYTNEDGTSAGSGILVLSCRLIESPASIIEGVFATMGFVSYHNTVVPVPGLDANHTLFHVVP